MLKKVDTKIKQKTQCLLSDIEKSDITELSNCSAANALIEVFSAIWSSLAMLNNFSSVDRISG